MMHCKREGCTNVLEVKDLSYLMKDHRQINGKRGVQTRQLRVIAKAGRKLDFA